MGSGIKARGVFGYVIGPSRRDLLLQIPFFRKPVQQQITYSSGDNHKQLDHVLLDRPMFQHCANAEAHNRTDLGSDHKA
eukprot:2593286-Pyramimonas_sp.AAC.1